MGYTVNGRTEHAVAERRPKYSFPYEKYDITVWQFVLHSVMDVGYFDIRFQYRPAEKNASA